jgi:dTDP-4-dehydrorhamnose reductase
VTGADIDDFDITSFSDCRDIVAERDPETVINAAAYTNVDACETDRDRCFQVNAEGVGHLARICRERGALLVHFSTDYVFDGSKGTPYDENDPCRPLSAYGASKYLGECRLREEGPEFLLVRTAWLYGRKGKNFVETILAKAKQDKVLRVVDDQVGSPTCTTDLAAAVKILVEGGHRGVFHVTNRGTCSWYRFAEKILALSGMDDVDLFPLTSEALGRPAHRPARSVLSTRKFSEATGKTLRFWQVALEDYLRSRRESAGN